MTTFYFDCGGILRHGGVAMAGDKVVWPHVFIPFDCELPAEHSKEKLTLMFLCDNPELSESRRKNVLVLPVHNTRMISKYAYFKF